MIRRLAGRDDSGYTLIEMLVALVISGILGGIVLSMLLMSKSSADSTKQQIDLSAEARTALNRIHADVQEAVPLTAADGSSTTPAITAVANPDGTAYDPSHVTSLTFNIDSSGNGCVAGIPSRRITPTKGLTDCTTATEPVNPNLPETETICWSPATQLIYLLADDPTTMNEIQPVTTCTSGQPMLAGKVTSFEVYYRSSLYRYQGADGITTWSDLDAAGPPAGNDDGSLDQAELADIDSVLVTLTLQENGHSQRFSTQIDLRNVNPS